MFLPVGDTPNPEGYRPWCTWGLIAINVIIFFTINYPLSNRAPNPQDPLFLEYVRMLVGEGLEPSYLRTIWQHTSLTDLLLFWHGYKPGDPTVITLFTSMFLHGGFMHLAGNMLFLYIYGDNVEHQLGHFYFLLMYLGTGVVATLSFSLLAGESLAPLVGASGAISGVLGFYFLMFPKNRVKVFILFFPLFIGVVRIPARIVLGIYVLWDNLVPLFLQTGGNVAHGAHLGGFFAGLGIAMAGEYFGWSLPHKKKPILTTPEHTPEESEEVFGSTSEQIIKATRQENIGSLLRGLKRATTSDLKKLTPQEAIMAARTLERHHLATPANRLLKVAITAHRASPNISELFYELGRLRFNQGYATAAYQHLLTALDHSPPKELELKAKSLLQKISH